MIGHALYAHQTDEDKIYEVKSSKILYVNHNNFSLISYEVIFYILFYNIKNRDKIYLKLYH